MKGVIIEGLAGTGKSTLLKLLLASSEFSNRFPRRRVWNEDLTLGELVTEMRDDNKADSERCKRIEYLLPAIKESLSQNEFVILERFHPSYFALMPRWELVNEIDEVLAAISFATVLLDFPDDLIESRCFFRPEVGDELHDNLVKHYGSKEEAISAHVASQKNRRKAIELSRLPYLIVDTGEKKWDDYAKAVVEFATR